MSEAMKMKQLKIRQIRMLLLFIIAAVAMLTLAPQSMAALQVTAFSCNGESGTVNVPNNLPFTCTATINNPDSSTASLGSVKLYIDGTWATQAYDASGFTTSLSTGASTTAVFVDVTPTTPGSHKFSYMLLDGVSDTLVADAVVNIMDIRVSKVTANVSSAAQNSNFTVTAELSIGGAMAVTTTIDPSDCSLATGETASKTVGSLTEGSQSSVSWMLKMGANDCSFTVSVTGTGSGRVTDDVSGSVSSTSTGSSPGSTPGGSSGGGGGGGGGGGAALVDESVLLSSIPAGSVGTFSFTKFKDIAVYEVAFTASVNLENAKLTVKEARLATGAPPASEKPSEAVYKYFSVNREKVSNEQTSDVKIRFRVPDSYLSKEQVIPESVVLKKLVNNIWVSNPTTMLGKSGSFTSYEASVSGLSTFAVVGEKKAGAVAKKAEPEEETEAEKAAAERAAAEEAARKAAEQQAQAQEKGAVDKFAEKIGGLGSSAKIVGTLVLILAAILIIIELMHFTHRKMPTVKLPKIPPPPIIGQQQKK